MSTRPPPSRGSRVKNITMADMGRREIKLAEEEMQGLLSLKRELKPSQPFAGVRISGSLHMCTEVAVFIETLQQLGAEVRWCSCDPLSTQDGAAAALAQAGSATVFAWANQTLEEYWRCCVDSLTWPGAVGGNESGNSSGNGSSNSAGNNNNVNSSSTASSFIHSTGPHLVVDSGGALTKLIHRGKQAEDVYWESGGPNSFDSILPNPDFASTPEEKCILQILRDSILAEIGGQIDGRKWTRMATECIRGVCEDTATGVQRLKELVEGRRRVARSHYDLNSPNLKSPKIIAQKSSSLLFPTVDVNSCVTKSKFENVYGSRHSILDSIRRATDVMIAGKTVVVCGFGDVGKGCATALRNAGAEVCITECDPICALQAVLAGFAVVSLGSGAKRKTTADYCIEDHSGSPLSPIYTQDDLLLSIANSAANSPREGDSNSANLNRNSNTKDDVSSTKDVPKPLKHILSRADIFVTTTGNKSVITPLHMKLMKNNAIVCNMGCGAHLNSYQGEVDVDGLEEIPGIRIENIKPNVDRYVFPSYVVPTTVPTTPKSSAWGDTTGDDGGDASGSVGSLAFPGKGVIVLGLGCAVNLACGRGQPSFVQSCSLASATLALVWINEGWRRKNTENKNTSNDSSSSNQNGNHDRAAVAGFAAAEATKQSKPSLLSNFFHNDTFERQPESDSTIPSFPWKNKVYTLPKKLDEMVARLHLPSLGAKLTELTGEQAEYIKVPLDGPYKPENYRY